MDMQALQDDSSMRVPCAHQASSHEKLVELHGKIQELLRMFEERQREEDPEQRTPSVQQNVVEDVQRPSLIENVNHDGHFDHDAFQRAISAFENDMDAQSLASREKRLALRETTNWHPAARINQKPPVKRVAASQTTITEANSPQPLQDIHRQWIVGDGAFKHSICAYQEDMHTERRSPSRETRERVNMHCEVPENIDLELIKASQAEINEDLPLEYTYVMWYAQTERDRDWNDCINVFGAFNTIQKFYDLCSELILPSRIPNGHDYMLFKEGVQPMWEDENNRLGGRWVVSLYRHQIPTTTDTLWYELMSAFITGGFTDDWHVVGIVVNRRQKGDKICVWTRDAEHTTVTRRIGDEMRRMMSLPKEVKLRYDAHHVAAGRRHAYAC